MQTSARLPPVASHASRAAPSAPPASPPRRVHRVRPKGLASHCAPSALRADKRLMNASSGVLSDSALALLQAESDEQVQLMGKPHQVEAVRANLEQRPPVFSTASA